MATRREIVQRIYVAALPLYGDAEARQIAEMIAMARGGITRNELLVEPYEELQISDLDSIIADVEAWRPVQYIIGRTDFDDMELEVCEGVLIPRPETEELVAWVANTAQRGARIVDLCTGSGCIALALARRIEGSRVVALDLSPEALAVARRNAERYAPSVEFVEGDALADFTEMVGCGVDVVVSNPPYIPVSDRVLMRRNVTEHEPAMALFVEDDDPLLFYRAIARTSQRVLSEGGLLFFEIYEVLAAEMCDMLAAEGYVDVAVREDFRGKQRMICARRSSID